MENYKIYHETIIKPLENKYTNIIKKLKTVSWYNFSRKHLYKKFRKKCKKEIDNHYSVYVDLFLFYLAKNPTVSKEDAKKTREIFEKAF